MSSLKIIFLLFVSPFFNLGANAQTIIQPSIGSKTHPSMSIDSLVMGQKETRVYIQIINENSEGTAWFCADKDISLVEKESQLNHKLIRSEGIPVCPESHTFSYAGEKLRFLLIFPGIENKKGVIDITENCADHCFSLKDIVTDPLLNEEIRLFEKAVVLYNQNEFEEAQLIFERLSSSVYQDENHYAYSLYILPVLYHKLGDFKQARLAYEKLKAADIVEKAYFIQKIKEIEFFGNQK